VHGDKFLGYVADRVIEGADDLALVELAQAADPDPEQLADRQLRDVDVRNDALPMPG
jgi:hypothetical protein